MIHLYDNPLRSTPVFGGQSGSLVSRLSDETGASKIVKVTRREEMPDYLTANYPSVDIAEYHFYTELRPLLDIPVPSLLAHGHMPQGGVFIVLEDIASNHLILPLGHLFTTAEFLAIMKTYALLHGRGEKLSADLKLRPWLHRDPRTALASHLVVPYLHELADNEWTAALAKAPLSSPFLPSLLTEVTARLAQLTTTILHNDFYPTNVAIPLDPSQPAVLLDWQLIGRGPLHLDLANIGLFGESPHLQAVDKDAVLSCYLETLAQETGCKISLPSLLEQGTYAKLLLALDFLPRFVRAMHRANALNEPWIPWMRDAYIAGMAEITRHL